MKKSKKKLFVTILCLCLVACMGGILFLMAASGGPSSVGISEETSPTSMTEEAGEEICTTTGMKMETVAKDDIIYLGKYTENNVDYNVPWVALDANGFVLSKHTLGNSVFHEQDGTYTDSTLKTVMDGFYAGDNALFTTGEKAVIKQTTLAGNSMYSGAADVNAYLYPLSYAEVETIGKDSTVLEATSITDMKGDVIWWWMRSSDDDDFAWSVYGIRSYFLDVLSTRIDSNYGVRPAFHMDSTPVLFKSAATNGKNGSDNTSSELKAVSNFNAADGWKLTLKDGSRDFTVTQITEDNNVVTIAYAGATIGDNEFISAIIKDSDNQIRYYGRIAQPENASGTATIDLSGIDMTDKTLYVFSEQCNGDKETDYASELKKVELTVKLEDVVRDAETETYILDKSAYVDGEWKESGFSISKSGDYKITWEIDGISYEQTVVLYRKGDINADDKVSAVDLVALKRHLAGKRDLNKSGTKAMDVLAENGDERPKALRTLLVD